MAKKVSENLFRLVKSLTPAEKRYFKIYVQRNSSGRESNYVRLFEAIDTQEIYNEEKLIKRFQKESFTKNFTITKGRLYETILRSLDVFHADSSVDAQLKRQLHCIEILYRKDLHDECLKELASAKRFATKYENYAALLDISMREKKIISATAYSGVSEKSLDKIHATDNLLFEKIKSISYLWNIKSKFFFLINKQGAIRNKKELSKFKQIIDNAVLENDHKDLSFETKDLFYHIYGAYYYAVGEYEKGYVYLKKHIHLVQSHTETIKEDPNKYVAILNNILNVCYLLKRYDEASEYLKKLRNITKLLPAGKSAHLEVKIFASSYNFELTVYIETGEFSKGVQLVPMIEKGLKKYEGKINQVQKILLYYNISVAYFGVEKYSEALAWTTKLLNDSNVAMTQDIYCFTKILNLIIHLELENNDFIPYAYKATFRFLNSKNRVYKFETVFLNFIGKIMKEKQPDLRKYYRELKEELLVLSDDPFEKPVFEHFDFISWVESKINKTPFKELFREKIKS
ncbi:MAG: hypothetical protein ABI199_00305 [Bacteroidia bacterium]